MSVLKYFKNTPRSPPIGRQAISVNFFSSNLQRGPWKKKGHVAPQQATGGPVAHPRATTGPCPRARQGGLSPPPPRATGVPPLI